jgi:hypothetical protein
MSNVFHTDAASGLVFMGSQYVKAFPCGRRKSELIDGVRYIPIDPEARLNTEANNRKHSGLNGYKQSYLRHWTTSGYTSNISLALAGYLFDIELPSTSTSTNAEDIVNAFGTNIAANFNDSINSIYVNILTTDVTFFSSVDGSSNANSTVGTEILRDQTFKDEPAACLDMPMSSESKDASDFYFSGLSFSAQPLKELKKPVPSNLHPESLLLLKMIDGKWYINESIKLPKIDHGDTKDSVKIPGDLTVEGDINVNGTITAKEVLIGGMKAITMEVVQTIADTDTSAAKWQLRFNNAKVTPLE